MEPGSQFARLSARSRRQAADVIGTIIAVITLIVPLAVIAYYSTEAEPLPSASYTKPSVKSR